MRRSLLVVAALALAASAWLLATRRLLRASPVVLAGTVPLPIFFAFTVPEHSDPQFLLASLVVPAPAGAAVVAARRAKPRP